VINLILVFSLSIHQIEYRKHLNSSVFEEYPEKITPLSLEPRPSGITHTFYGYLPYWVDTLYYDYFQMELLTHIAYFAVEIDPSTGNLGSIPYFSRFNKILNYAHSRGVKIHMTFIIFGSSNVSQFLNSSTARLNAINNIKTFISNYGIDGVNIDFEFVTGSVRDSFNKFINDLYYEILNHPDGRKELFIATPAVPEWYPGYDVAYLSNHSDGLFIMAYDFHYSGSSVAGPVAPNIPSSFWGQYSVAKTIGSYKQYGANPEKLILGIPFYGYDWPTVSSDIGSNTTGSGTAVIFYYAKQNAASYGRLWDNYSLTPWYRYYSGGWHQTWYDDSVSIDIKLSLAVDSGLAGAGCWALGYARSEDDLWNVIRKNFWLENPDKHFVVKVESVGAANIYDMPDTNSNIISIATYNSKLVSFLYKNGFYKIYFPSATGNYYGWVKGGDGINKKYLSGSTGNKTIRVTASLLNVREGPSTSYNIITQVSRGQCFVIDSTYGNWVQIFIGEINSFEKGWVHSGYVRIIENIEDSNNPHFNILSLYYPSQLNSCDTFNLKIYAFNNGYVPYDSLVYLKSVNDSSLFYNPNSFIDKRRVKTESYNALPGQYLYIDIKLKAPSVPDTQIVSESFFFERKGTEFGDTFTIYTNIIPLKILERNNNLNIIKFSSNIFNERFKITSHKNIEEIIVFDISGRKIYRETNTKNFVYKKGRTSGIYFILLNRKRKLKVLRILTK